MIARNIQKHFIYQPFYFRFGLFEHLRATRLKLCLSILCNLLIPTPSIIPLLPSVQPPSHYRGN